MPRGLRDKETGKYTTAKECSKRQLDIIYSLVYEDLAPLEMLKKYGVPTSTYYDWYGQELFVNRLREEREKRFKAMSTEAQKKLSKLMNCGDSRTELKAAQLILQENGHLRNESELAEKTTEIVITLADTNE